jgi:GTP pyrophosphokinase
MDERRFITEEERLLFIHTCRLLLKSMGDAFVAGDTQKVRAYLAQTVVADSREIAGALGMNALLRSLQTALIVSEEIGLKRASVLSVLLLPAVRQGLLSADEAGKAFGDDIGGILKGLLKTSELYAKSAAIETENFRKLLLSFAEDVRVILIMIADRLLLMRQAKGFESNDMRLKISAEASSLYVPLAHRLGLYKIKSEMEDLALKYTDRESYDYIAGKINETKRSRDRYIAEFIAPVEKKLKDAGLKFDIKGRTKSISSIRNKLLKQKIEFERIYDLFAIRVILDASAEKEKADCWQVYSIITDMYRPNPSRMKDWLSIPKSNGYESLHATVMGPESRWVEIQIRSRRMDEVAERGLAAHWKYKGIKGESGLDEWLNGVREALENRDTAPGDLIRDFRMDLYDEEIFVFTPKGDLFKLPKGATVLDFAFAIHTKLGSKCVSGKINGKNVAIKHRLKSGDQVELLTSPGQSPKRDWLSFVVTSRARTKIKQSLKEESAKQAEYARELLQRRFKNKKIEADEARLMRLIKKMGYKTVTDFYAEIAGDRLDVNTVIDQYLEFEKKEQESVAPARSAEQFLDLHQAAEEELSSKDELVIDQNLKGIDYKLAKCCNPIYGDEIFGFVSSQGIRIHRTTCPNAPDMFKRFGYRVVNARWSGKSGLSYPITLRVVGHDDIGIVTNITSVISKENGMNMRSISIDSNDGLFQGAITVMLSDTSALDSLIRKIKAIKGVMQAERV